MSLDGKVVIVTGSGSGIGRATAILFSKRGASVVLVGRRVSKLRETSSQMRENSALIIQADVSKLADARRIVEETLAQFGKVDILVNNAGVEGPHKTVVDMTENEWDAVMENNLKGVFLCSKFAISAMKKNGRGVVTNVSSNWGIVGAAYSAAYCASKAAVILLTKAMAIDHANNGIVVNCICPGDVDTPMMQRALEKYPNRESRARNEGKFISPEEVAHAIAYLVSDEAAMTTGTALVVDNGATAGEGPQLLPSRKQLFNIRHQIRYPT
jgi:NAD(P)-dependent dehydrogenase (short-subunit alcohol dehydrogenase family)